MSELPRPRGRRRSSDSDEAETVCNNEGGEDYAPRECPRAASLPLAFIEQGLAFAYPSAPNRRRRFLWTRLFKGSSSASLRAPRTHQIARRGGAWRCLTTLGSSMPPANGTPTAFPRHAPALDCIIREHRAEDDAARRGGAVHGALPLLGRRAGVGCGR